MASPRQTGASGTEPASATALVRAATELLADRPPSAISGRELAEAAGVNYGLVHRHFGSKGSVLARAFDELLTEYAVIGLDDRGVPRPLRLAQHRDAWRALAHVSLDPAGFGHYRAATPVLDRCLDGIAAARPELDSDQTEAVVGLGLAIEAGLPIHRPVLAPALGLDGDDDLVDELVAGWLDGLYRGHGPLGVPPVVAPDDIDRAANRTAVDSSRGSGVDDRLVAAAAELLIDHAPSAISGRQLAEAAGVNYGLVHHYFGSKDEVLRRAVQLHRDRFFAAHAGADWSPRFFSVCEHRGYVRAMTWHALDPSVADAPQHFPVTDQMVRRLVRPGVPAEVERTLRVAILTVVALQMAWALFLPVLEQSFGRDPRPLERRLVPLLRNLLVDPMNRDRAAAGTLSR